MKNYSILALIAVVMLTSLLNSKSLAQTSPQGISQPNAQASSQTTNAALAVDDITAVTNDLALSVHQLVKPTVMYHWTNMSSARTQQPFSEHDPIGLTMTQRGAAVYWNAYGRNDGNVYGGGLYMAVDPITTNSFGAGEGWVLLEITLPTSFRVLDVGGMNALSSSTTAILSRHGCGTPATLSDLMKPNQQTRACRNFVMTVFDHNLKIDGFFYNYDGQNFNACNGIDSYQRAKALVVTSAKSLDLGMIEVYNSHTTANFNKRLIIQSLYYKGSHDRSANNQDDCYRDSRLQDVLAKYSSSTSSVCMLPAQKPGDECGMKLVMCPHLQNDCDMHPGCTTQEFHGRLRPPSVYPTTIDSHGRTLYTAVLWNDLDGHQTVPNIEMWLKENLFACGDAGLTQ